MAGDGVVSIDTVPGRSDLTVLREEREELCETLSQLDADAPTLCAGWTAMDIAAHLWAQERADGLLGLVSYAVGVPVMLAGLRAGSRIASANQRAAVRGHRRDDTAILAGLRRGPPAMFGLPVLAPGQLLENWVHHEDIRRSCGCKARPSEARVEAMLWRALRLYGRYQRRAFSQVSVCLSSHHGLRMVVGKGPPVIVQGPAGELVLYMAGRREAAEVEVAGEPAALERLSEIVLTI